VSDRSNTVLRISNPTLTAAQCQARRSLTIIALGVESPREGVGSDDGGNPIERPEALDTGSIIATELRLRSVHAGIRAATTDHGVTDVRQDYLSKSCGVRGT
jgi:hypothetical protein